MRAIYFSPSSLSSDLKIRFTKKKPIVSESQKTNQVPIPAITTGATFTNISNASLLCQFNDYLPLGKNVRQTAMPIVYYCRFLDFSIPTNIFQLLFCIAALFFALNRRSNLFVFCYCFLCLTLLISGIFFAGLLLLDYQTYMVPAIEMLLWGLLRTDSKFCEELEPLLDCRMTNGSDFDEVEQVCGLQRSNVTQIECIDYLTSSLMSKNWLIGLILEYTVVIFTGIFVTVRAIRRRFCEISEIPSTRGSMGNRCNGQNGTAHETHPLVN